MGIRVMSFRIENPRKKSNEMKIQKKIRGDVFKCIGALTAVLALQYNGMGPDEDLVRVTFQLHHLHFVQSTGSDLEREAATLIILYLYGYLASIKASHCIASNQPVTQDIHQLYSLSLDCDLMSGKLKYASMLYCSGQYAQAAQMLAHCEGLLGSDVAHYCGCIGKQYAHQSWRYLEKGLHKNTTDLLRTSFTTCVKFTIHELPCVPEHLRYEMYRTQTQEDRKKRHPEQDWMDLVVIDCLPFLFYLQFLVYRQMGQPDRQVKAMQNLQHYITFAWLQLIVGHKETALHVAAHCCELLNRSDVAWHCYNWSIQICPNNNVAWIHLVRLFKEHFL